MPLRSHDDLRIVPRGQFGRPCPPEVIVHEDKPAEYADIAQSLHGKRRRSLGKPQTLIVDFPRDGELVVHVAAVCLGAELSIHLDGRLARTVDLPAKIEGDKRSRLWAFGKNLWRCDYDQDFSVPVPKGKHRIVLENSKDTGSWIQVAYLVLKGYRRHCISYRYGLRETEEKAFSLKLSPGRANLVRIRLFFLQPWFGGLYLGDRYLGNFGGKGTGVGNYEYVVPVGDASGAALTFSLRRRSFFPRVEPGETVCLLRDTQVIPMEAGERIMPPEFQPQPITRAVKVAPNGRYFMLEDGSSFYPVGVTGAIFGDRIDFREQKIANWNYGSVEKVMRVANEWIPKLARHGVNHLRLCIQLPFEPQLGVYPAERVKALDAIMDLCQRLGVYVELNSIDHTEVLSGAKSPYYLTFQKPKGAGNYRHFFASPEARKWVEKKTRFLLERYRENKALMSYEAFNELSAGPAPDDKVFLESVLSYYADIGKCMRRVRPGTLQCVNAVAAQLVSGGAAEYLANVPEVDYLAPHCYGSLPTADILRLGGAKRKPVCTGEGWSGVDPPGFGETKWEEVFSGVAGSTRPWHMQPNVLSDDHLNALAAFAAIVREVDWARLDPLYSPLLHVPKEGEKVRSNERCRYILDAQNRQALVWVESSPDARVSLPAFRGTYRVRCFDPSTGNVLQDERAGAADAGLEISCSKTARTAKEVIYVQKH